MPPLTVPVRVCLAPLASVTSTVTTLPSGALVVPVMVGVVSAVLSGAVTVMVGAVVSRVALSLPGAETLPALSVRVAVTVRVPPSAGLAKLVS